MIDREVAAQTLAESFQRHQGALHADELTRRQRERAGRERLAHRHTGIVHLHCERSAEADVRNIHRDCARERAGYAIRAEDEVGVRAGHREKVRRAVAEREGGIGDCEARHGVRRGSGRGQAFHFKVTAQTLAHHDGLDVLSRDAEVASGGQREPDGFVADEERLVDGGGRVVDLQGQFTGERDAGHEQVHHAAEVARDAATTHDRAALNQEAAATLGQRENRLTAIGELKSHVRRRDANHLATALTRQLLEREITTERLAQDRELHSAAFDAHIRSGGKFERHRVPTDGEGLVHQRVSEVDGHAEAARERDARNRAEVHLSAQPSRRARRTQHEITVGIRDADKVGRAIAETQRSIRRRHAQHAPSARLQQILNGEITAEVLAQHVQIHIRRFEAEERTGGQIDSSDGVEIETGKFKRRTNRG